MKRFLLCLLLSALSYVGFAQNQIDLTIKYNLGTARYEVYAIPNFSAPGSATNNTFRVGLTQITVVIPKASNPQPLSISSVAGGTWIDNTQVYAPPAAPSSDFHAVATTGNAIVLQSGVEALLFTFTLPGGCVPGVRLFNNNVDPSSSALEGGDFNINFDGTFNGVGIDYYRTNVNNNGTSCNACNLVAPTLSK